MTVFEKIYWTSWIVAIVLWFVGEYLEKDFSEFDIIANILKDFIELEVFFIIGYWIVKLVLCIWGIHICLFPTLVRDLIRW